MKKIAVLTATRAEYGLLAPIIKKLKSVVGLETFVLATGMHLAPEFGSTYREIESDGVRIDKKIEILLSADTPSAISKSMGLALIGFADYFSDQPLDALMVLGDRYETLAVSCAAMNARIPIIHLYGGETTIGAVDEAIRHSITKMSCLHFTSTAEYRRRVIQLGEAPERVFNVGAMGVENALNTKFLTREELSASIGFNLDGVYAVVTFHPVTLEGDPTDQIEELLSALDGVDGMKFLMTKANADAGGRLINERLTAYVSTRKNCLLVESLGARRYLSALKYAALVIGNSSSGIMEAPAFKIPTVNIGDRQTGRLKPESVIDCSARSDEIAAAIERARRLKSAGAFDGMINPYGDGRTSEKIVSMVADWLLSDRIELKKIFYDLPTTKGA